MSARARAAGQVWGARCCYHVMLLRSGRWGVIREGARRPSVSADTQSAALLRAKGLTRIARADHVLLHEESGQIKRVEVEQFERR
jgi:hypothetical protein